MHMSSVAVGLAAGLTLLATPAVAAPGCDNGTKGDDVIRCSRFDDSHPGDPATPATTSSTEARATITCKVDGGPRRTTEEWARTSCWATRAEINWTGAGERLPARSGGRRPDPGGDSLAGNERGDLLDGGPGGDQLGGDEGSDSLYGGPGSDRLSGNANPDRLFGEAGTDVLNGRAGSDVLKGGAGADVLCGDAGEDVLFGGEGDDVIYAADLRRDRIRCGRGRDWVEANSVDVVHESCESVQRVG
jgi:hypothetical protein